METENQVQGENDASNSNLENTTESSEQQQDNESVEKTINDPFSSENFKIEVKNLPKSFGYGQIKKFFTSLNLNYVKIKAPNNGSFAFLTFPNEEARKRAMDIVNQTTYKGKQLEACFAKPQPDPVVAKRKFEQNENNTNKNLRKEDEQSKESSLSLEERVLNSTIPLWNLSYDKQIEQKRTAMKQILRKSLQKMEKASQTIFFWLQKQKQLNEGMCCPLVEILESPVIESYRNKCEFTIGYNEDETKNVIGFRLGDFKSGSNQVVEPYCCQHISNEMKDFIKVFLEYVNNSKYKPFNVRTREGHWRQLTMRSNENKELLVIVVFDKHELDDDRISEEKKVLTEYFSKFEPNGYKLKGLLFNLNTNKSGISKMDNLDLLVGEDYLYESLFDLKFRISPLAFFQANTKGAEVLYKKIGDLCDIDENTVVLDICCGTGTIGLTLARKVKLVVGVEIIQEAIDDAKLNSFLNNIQNVEYHCGKAEEVLPNILKKFTNEKVVAIVDPPRAGLHSKVIQCLRRLENLNCLIYVSCNPELAMQNFVDLARESSKHYALNPFVPLKAVAVDMFPLTSHCELILQFKRYTNQMLSDS